MDEKVIKFKGKTLKSNVKMLISEDPDVVYKTIIKIKIKKEDLNFWINFINDWGHTIPQLHNKNKELYKQGKLTDKEYEYYKRVYDLALYTLASFFDKLLEWIDSEQGDFIFEMNPIDCYFIATYLDDYKQVNKFVVNKCDIYIKAILHALDSNGGLNERLDAIGEIVEEYINNREAVFLE